METKTLREVKIGEFFRLRTNGKVYVRDEYNRSEKRFEYYDFDDICNFHLAKGEKKVITGFTF